MPFGKYQGKPIAEIPEGYLVWVLGNVECLSPMLRDAIERQLDIKPATRPTPQPRDHRTELDVKLRGWHRELALRYHPDRKGSTEVMAAINDAYDRLRKVLSL